jgi:oligopeptidase B
MSSIDTINQKLGLDPFKWLENKNDSEVISYLNAENAYSDQFFDRMKNTVDSIALLFRTYNSELMRIKNLPEKKGSYYYYRNCEPGKKYFTHLRTRDTISGIKEKILDEDELAGNASNFQLTSFRPSPDEQHLAVIFAYNGNRSILKIKDIQRDLFTDSLDDIESCVWSSDSRSIVCTTGDKNVILCRIGRGNSKSKIIYTERDDRFMTDVGISASGKFIFITSYNNETTEVRYLPADLSRTKPRLIQKRIDNVRYYADNFAGDYFWFLTNLKAPELKIVKTRIASPGLKNWVDVIPTRPNIIINDYSVVKNEYLVLEEQENLKTRIRIVDYKSLTDHLLSFPVDRNELSIIYTDTVQCKLTIGLCNEINPGSIYEYDLRKQELKLIRDLEIKGYDKSKYSVKSLWIPGDSDILIPVTLLYKNQPLSPDRKPLFLHAYGSYGAVFPVVFMPKAILLLDLGFYVVFAFPRGGGELGDKWWDGGRLLNKKNTFKDYIRCAEYLVDKGYTSKGGIVGYGASAGGLIMGYAANERPELFRGLILDHPDVDPLTSQLDSTLNPSQPNEWLELGNPNIKTYYDYIQSYAPYNNVKKQSYPAMLFITGLLDNNVNYWEPAKMVALLRNKKQDSNSLLLRTQMKGTHSGENIIENDLMSSAERFAFILQIFGFIK